MRNLELKKYQRLNEIAEQGGIVIFGSDEDMSIPVGELRQAFSIESKMYNRSFSNLSIKDALEVYKKIIEPLEPETLLLHIGSSDLAFFSENPTEFDNKYRELLGEIRLENPKIRIAIVSLRNYTEDTQIQEMNTHLKYIADSEKCEYGDISNKKVWNPKNTIDMVSFIYSLNYVRHLNNKRPLYDLVKMTFGYAL